MNQMRSIRIGMTATAGCTWQRASFRTGALFAIGLLALPLLVGCGGVTQADHDRATVEIAGDLIGETVLTGQGAWRFAGPEEFEAMRIVSVNGDKNETRFVVDMDLTDMYTHEKFSMRASVNYFHDGSDDWTLTSVSCIKWSKRY